MLTSTMMKLIFSRAMNYNQENKYVYTTIIRLRNRSVYFARKWSWGNKIKIIYNIDEMKLKKVSKQGTNS